MTTPKKSWLRRQLARFAKSQRGATAVEFAIVAGPFFYVLGCICETGLMLFTEYVIQNSVQEAARIVRTGQASDGAGAIILTQAEFKAELCGNVSIIIDCDGKVSIYVNNADKFASLTTAMPDPLDVGPKANGARYSTVYQPGAELRTTTVIASYDWDFAFPFMDFLGNFGDGSKRRLYGLAIFRNEPFGT